MLQKRQRLSPANFPRRTKKARFSGYFIVKTIPNTRGDNRFAIVVGAKVEKKAVRRNFWKRRIAGILQGIPPRGDDYLIVALPKLAALPPRDLRKEVFAAIGESEPVGIFRSH